MLPRRLPLLLFSFAIACGPAAEPLTPPPPWLDSPHGSVTPRTTTTPPKPRFENPGGMWTPEQLAQHDKELASLGLEIPVASLANPTVHPLGSVVSLGGCSAAFVSPDGLIATNHHCATGALQYNSTPHSNFLRDGHLAKNHADERWNGPTARVLVTQAIRDVTKEVRDGIDAIKDDTLRQKKMEDHEKALVAACEKDRPGIRCNVASYFGGAAFRLIEQLEIKDVRLVFAPHEGVGNFGGEID